MKNIGLMTAIRLFYGKAQVSKMQNSLSFHVREPRVVNTSVILILLKVFVDLSSRFINNVMFVDFMNVV